MKKISLLSVLAVFLMVSATHVYASESTKIEEQTLETAMLWTVLIDQGMYAQSWEQASQKFKDAMEKDEWAEKLELFRKPLGDVKSREVLDRGFFESIPNHPGMSMMVIQFKASFENKEYAVETISVIRVDEGPWQAAGYYIADSIDTKVQ